MISPNFGVADVASVTGVTDVFDVADVAGVVDVAGVAGAAGRHQLTPLRSLPTPLCQNLDPITISTRRSPHEYTLQRRRQKKPSNTHPSVSRHSAFYTTFPHSELAPAAAAVAAVA